MQDVSRQHTSVWAYGVRVRGGGFTWLIKDLSCRRDPLPLSLHVQYVQYVPVCARSRACVHDGFVTEIDWYTPAHPGRGRGQGQGR